MMSDRPETGPMRFGDDWRGVFLRGDNACDYAMQLEAALDPRNGPEMRVLFAEQLRPLVALLNGANEFVEATGEQVLRPFAACRPVEDSPPDVAPLDLDAIDRDARGLIAGHGWVCDLGTECSECSHIVNARTALALIGALRASRARAAALVWAVLDERRMKALHRAALREEINASVLDTDSDRENAAMAESRETAEAAEEATARLDDLLRGGAPTGVIPAEAAQAYRDAERALEVATVDAGRALAPYFGRTMDEIAPVMAEQDATLDRARADLAATRTALDAVLLAATGGAPR